MLQHRQINTQQHFHHKSITIEIECDGHIFPNNFHLIFFSFFLNPNPSLIARSFSPKLEKYFSQNIIFQHCNKSNSISNYIDSRNPIEFHCLCVCVSSKLNLFIFLKGFSQHFFIFPPQREILFFFSCYLNFTFLFVVFPLMSFYVFFTYFLLFA